MTDPGREVKSEREALQILSHYAPSDPEESQTDNGKVENLSLDEELKLLKQEMGPKHSFSVFDTGCRATVFLMCVKPGCYLIPYKQESSRDAPLKTDDTENTTSEGGEPSKRAKVEEKEDSEIKSDSDPWDPIPVVRSILTDIRKKDSTAPSSRFISRMIPIQATCYASLPDLETCCQRLIQKLLPKDCKTFCVAARRRNCSTLTTTQIIDAVVKEVLTHVPACKVQLKNPSATIVVEVCKTLCGVSIVEDCQQYGNFNLLTARLKEEPVKNSEEP